jgi:lysozyme
MKASQVCIDLIKRFEGLKLDAYLCPAGIPTIGYGHTRCVHIGQHITTEFADVLLAEDIEAVEDDLDLMLHVPVTQGQWDALVSLCFNLAGGARALPRKAPLLWSDLQAGKKVEAAHEFLDLDHANGKELWGLKLRRQAEAALFLSGASA